VQITCAYDGCGIPRGSCLMTAEEGTFKGVAPIGALPTA
jgi:hypothetical protein